MIDKGAPLPWVEAQDLPRRGAGENEKGAPREIYTFQPPQKPPDPTTTASRSHIVICIHLDKKRDIFNTPLHTRKTNIDAASDKKYISEATTERAGLGPCGSGTGQSVRLTLDAARRKGLPQSYRAFGRIQPQNSLTGHRPKATTKYYTKQTHKRTQKISGITHALLCCACLDAVMYPMRTHAPPTDIHPTREIPHPNSTADPQENKNLGRYVNTRKNNKAAANHEDLGTQPKDRKLQQPHGTLTGGGATKPQEGREQTLDQRNPSRTRGTNKHEKAEEHKATT
jgi:hypothetical protein